MLRVALAQSPLPISNLEQQPLEPVRPPHHPAKKCRRMATRRVSSLQCSDGPTQLIVYTMALQVAFMENPTFLGLATKLYTW